MKVEGLFGQIEMERWHTPQGHDIMILFDVQERSFYMRPSKLEKIVALFSTNYKHLFHVRRKEIGIQSYHKNGHCFLVAWEIPDPKYWYTRNECCAVFSEKQCQDIRRFIHTGQALELEAEL